MDGMLSQEEINALLGSMESGSDDSSVDDVAASAGDTSGIERLSSDESDALGEISNISMGTAATTLSILVNNRVVITTPQISYVTLDELSKQYEEPCVFIYISYQAGLQGKNVLVLKEQDVKVITDLMMGGDGTNTDNELSDLHLSAISEAMNQMMGSAATSMSSMLNEMVDISPPVASQVDFSRSLEEQLKEQLQDFEGKSFVQVSFKMEIGDLVDSEIMQLYPIEFAREIYKSFVGSLASGEEKESVPTPEPEPVPVSAPEPAPAPAPTPVAPEAQPTVTYQEPVPNYPMGGMAQQQQPAYAMPQQNLNIQPAGFQSFSPVNLGANAPENIDLIMDVPLEVTVELGRTNKSIHDILDFAPGTIIELNKLAGEPIDVLVNGKFVAKGEVVVIEESFGIRVTEIIKD